MFLNGGDALSGLGDAEGEHGEVVVLLGAVAELVGVGLEGLDDASQSVRHLVTILQLSKKSSRGDRSGYTQAESVPVTNKITHYTFSR